MKARRTPYLDRWGARSRRPARPGMPRIANPNTLFPQTLCPEPSILASPSFPAPWAVGGGGGTGRAGRAACPERSHFSTVQLSEFRKEPLHFEQSHVLQAAKQWFLSKIAQWHGRGGGTPGV